jgi:hypothetical protein
MYTPTGTFEATFCFLAGFYDGMIAHQRDTQLQALATQHWYGFLEWLQQHVSDATSASWQELYRAIRHIAPDDQQAFQFLIAHYRAYREEYTSTPSTTDPLRW